MSCVKQGRGKAPATPHLPRLTALTCRGSWAGPGQGQWTTTRTTGLLGEGWEATRAYRVFHLS